MYDLLKDADKIYQISDDDEIYQISDIQNSENKQNKEPIDQKKIPLYKKTIRKEKPGVNHHLSLSKAEKQLLFMGKRQKKQADLEKELRRPKHEAFIDEIYKMRNQTGVSPKKELIQIYNLIQGEIDKPILTEEACQEIIDNYKELLKDENAFLQKGTFTKPPQIVHPSTVSNNKRINSDYIYVKLQNSSGEVVGRIVINLNPVVLSKSLEVLLSVLKKYPQVKLFKIAGPETAQKKNDSVIIYLTTKNIEALQPLFDQLKQLNLTTDSNISKYLYEVCPGIGFAYESVPINKTNISFSEKRAIIGYMLLEQCRKKKLSRENMYMYYKLIADNLGLNNSEIYKERMLPDNPIKEIMTDFNYYFQLFRNN